MGFCKGMPAQPATPVCTGPPALTEALLLLPAGGGSPTTHPPPPRCASWDPLQDPLRDPDPAATASQTATAGAYDAAAGAAAATTPLPPVSPPREKPSTRTPVSASSDSVLRVVLGGFPLPTPTPTPTPTGPSTNTSPAPPAADNAVPARSGATSYAASAASLRDRLLSATQQANYGTQSQPPQPHSADSPGAGAGVGVIARPGARGTAAFDPALREALLGQQPGDGRIQ